MKLRPLGNRILVSAILKESTSLIVIPDVVKANQKPTEFLVEAIGNSKEINVACGDTVIANAYSGSVVKYGDKEYRIYNMDDIIAVID